MPASTEVVDRQLDAYRKRDLDAFLSCYVATIKVTDLEGHVLMDLEGMRERYGRLFDQSPNLTAMIANRIVVGDVVIDEEEVQGFNLADYSCELHAVVAYHVTGDKIDRVVFLKVE